MAFGLLNHGFDFVAQMTKATIAQGISTFLTLLNDGVIENGLGGEMGKAKMKVSNTRQWALKAPRPGMKKPNMMGHYKPIYTFTGERL